MQGNKTIHKLPVKTEGLEVLRVPDSHLTQMLPQRLGLTRPDYLMSQVL